MDTIGRIGFWIDDTPYKLCTVFLGKSDGSLYIGSNFGRNYEGGGLSPAKITYHPDGGSWVTSDLQESVVGQDFIDQANSTHIKNLSIKNGRIYAKGETYQQHPSFDEIETKKLTVRLLNSCDFYNIHTGEDYGREYVVENSTKKLKLTSMVNGRDYFGINIKFYLAEKSRQPELDGVLNDNPDCEWFKFDVPGRGFSIYVILSNTSETPGGTS